MKCYTLVTAVGRNLADILPLEYNVDYSSNCKNQLVKMPGYHTIAFDSR